MSITDPLVLMPDTTFTPIADLPKSVREQVQAQFGQRTGYALTQPHARKPSTLVDDETAELLRDFATPSTIARLHANGVVHGDAHPGNLIVSPDGTVRIVDFGIARWPGLRDLRGAEPPRDGVPGYIAPDQARAMLAGVLAGPATQSSDLYCLAVLLYELFTGTATSSFRSRSGRCCARPLAHRGGRARRPRGRGRDAGQGRLGRPLHPRQPAQGRARRGRPSRRPGPARDRVDAVLRQHALTDICWSVPISRHAGSCHPEGEDRPQWRGG